jgi:membrane protein YqaA with SNARE-associated domain
MKFLRRLLKRKAVRTAFIGLGVGLVVALIHPDRLILAPYLLWSVPTNSILMVPNEPAAIAAVQMLIRTNTLLDAALLITFVGVIGAGVACILDQTILQWFAQKDRVRDLLDHPYAETATRWFRVWPFGTVLCFSILPLPYILVRLLAAATRYPVERYTTATMLGRIPRIFLLCLLGGWWVMPSWAVALLFVSAVSVAFVVPRRLVRIRAGINRREHLQ